MKILFVHEVSYRSKVIFEMHEIPELLAERGHESFFVDFPEDEKIPPFHFKTRMENIRGRVHPNTRLTLFSLPRFFPHPLDRIWTAIWGGISIRAILAKTKPDVVFLYGVPTNGWQTLLLARGLKIPVVYRAIDMSHKIRVSLFAKPIKIAEKFVIKNSDLVLTNNDAMKKYVNSYFSPAKHPQVETLLAGVQGVNETLLWSDTNLEKTIPEVVFMGTLFHFAGLSWFIREMHVLKTQGISFNLLVIGDGEARRDLENLTKELGLSDDVRFLGMVPFEGLYEAMKQSDVAIIPFDETELTHVAMPAKVPQYLVAGLPTVATRLRGLQSLLPDGVGVIYRAPGEDFMNGLIGLIGNSASRAELVRTGQSHLQEFADWNMIIDHLEDKLTELVLSRGPAGPS